MAKAKKLKVIDLSKILKPYHNKWVALSPDKKKVVGSGDTPKQAYAASLKAGVKDPILTKTPKDYESYIL